MSIIRKSDKNDRKKKNFSVGIALLILLVIAVLTYVIFEKSGLWLVEDDDFEHVKWVAVLDGQTSDLERSDFAANLLKEGKADSVLLLGRRVFRDRSNSEFYADDFMKLGSFDSNAVFLVPHNDPSTISEAYTLIPWLKARNIDTVLLITSATSTYRVKRIFQKLSGNGPVFLTTNIQHITFNPACWYNNRESRKDWLRSWAALFASYFDLFNIDTLSAGDSSYYKPIRSYAEYKNESEKEDLKDSVATSTKATVKEAVKDSSKAQEKAPAKVKEQPKDAPKATVKETPKEKKAEAKKRK